MAVVVAIAADSALSASGTLTSRCLARDAEFPRGVGVLQYACTGQVQIDVEFSLDGVSWVSKQTIAAGTTSGLVPIEMVFAPMMRIKATEKAGASATAGVLVDC